LINPSEKAKQEFQNILANDKQGVRIYLYQNNDDIDWLLSVFNEVDYVYLDLDNSNNEIKNLSSFFIAHSKTYWLTKGEYREYNKLSVNRTYDMSWAWDKIKGEGIPNEE